MGKKMLMRKFGSVAMVNNTFIGGVAEIINTPEILSTYLNHLSVSNIQNFTIVGADIECLIETNYTINGFNVNQYITYFEDRGGFCTLTSTSAFGNNCPKLTYVIINGAVKFGSNLIGGSYAIRKVVAPNCYETTSGAFAGFYKGIACYIPNCLNLGGSPLDNAVFTNCPSSLTIYAHPSLQTNNGGGEDGDLAYARAMGTKIAYVTNLTAPNAITDLSASNILGSVMQLNFTPPTSANGIDYYEVWVNDKYYQTIQASGDKITQLSSNTTYSIKLIAIDMLYNKSISNEITETTSATFTIPTANIINSYQMEGNLLDSAGTNNGTGTDVAFETGTVGQRAIFNGSTSKITLGQITKSTKMSIVVRLKLTKDVPTVASKCGLMYLNSENSASVYPYINNGISLCFLTNSRKSFSPIGGFSFDKSKEHLLIITADETANVWKCYQNNFLIHTGTVGTITTLTAPTIGKGNGNYWFDGTIDEIYIFNTILTVEDISEITEKSLIKGQHL